MKYSCERVFRACSRTTEQCFVYLVYLLIELIIIAATPTCLVHAAQGN